jgi:hypothetical protein
VIRSGIQDWWFCKLRGCGDTNRVPSLGGTLWTRVFFERWKRDWQKSSELRRVLNEADRGRAVHRLSDEEVVEQIALLVERGEIHIHASSAWVHVEEHKSQSGYSAPAPAFPLSARRGAQGPDNGPGSPDDPSTFSDPLDSGAQVAALMAASSQGAPFCPE